MRNRAAKVGRARAGRHSLFQCLECEKMFARSCSMALHLKSHDRERALACKEGKELLSNKMQKSVSTEDNAKETAAENSSVFKKIFVCPYCDKVFTREGWLAPHIRSHKAPSPRKEEILPDHLKKRARRTIGVFQLPDAGLNEQERVTEELNGNSEIGSEQPAKIQETSQLTLGSERDSQSKTTSVDSERIIDGSSEITEEPHVIPGGSTGEGEGVKRSKKAFPCQKPVMRNRAAKVGRARAGRHLLFQCLECEKMFARSCSMALHLKSHDRERALACKEGKELLSNKMQKSVSTEDNAKETAAENSSVFKKIFACPYCDKVFTREGWLAPHIRSHKAPSPRKEEILPSKKRARRTIGVFQLPDAGLNEQERVTEELNGNSEIGSEQPAKIQETSQLTLGSERDSQSKTTSVDSERIIDGSSEITEEPHVIPGGSTGEGEGVKRSKKAFPCRMCGKIYFHAGWLKTHIKFHRAENMNSQNRRRRMVEELKKERETDKQSLMDNVVEKKQKRLMKMKHSLDRKAKNQDTAGMKKNANCVCSHCGKVYARRNWLKMHMLGHRKPIVQTNVSEENAQIPQELSSTEDPTVPKGKDGGKASYPCPFCPKVFRRGMRLMVHMQIHSGEKPYSYRERKEQFYGDLTKARVPDTYSQEPAIESNDEKEKDGRFTVTRNQTPAVSQDHTSTTEPMETVEPHSVCTGKKFSLLPLQSAGAVSNHSLNHPGTPLDSVSSAMSLFSLQPRIVLEPIVPGFKSWASPADDGFRSVKANTSDAKTVDATASVVDYPGKHYIPQTPPENANTYDSKNVLSDINIIVVSDAHDPDIVHSKLDSDAPSYEDTSHPENMLVSIGGQQTAESPEGRMFWPRDGQEKNLGYSSLSVKQTTDRSKAELGAEDVAPFWNSSSIKSSCDDNFDDILQPKAPGFILSESSSTGKEQIADPESVCFILSNSDGDDDDHNYDHDTWSNVSDNEPKNKYTRSKTKTGGKGDATSHPAQSHLRSSLQKATGAASHVDFILDKAEEMKACDGLPSNKDELVNTSSQQAKKNSKSLKSSATCMICGLVFAGNVSLSRHMRVHSRSGRTGKNSSAMTTSIQQTKKNSKDQETSSTCLICGLIFAGKVSLSRHMRVHSSSGRIGKTSSAFNSETKDKHEVVHVQASKVRIDDSTDNSEILGKSDSATEMEAIPAKSSVVHPATGSQSSKAALQTSTKGKELIKGRSTVYCRFCSKACRKIELHLKYDHPREPEVIEAFNCSKTLEERKKLLSHLCSKKTLESDYTVVDEHLVHCLFCQGSYRRNQFWKHALICEPKEPKWELTQTEAASSVYTPNAHLKTRPNIAQKTFDTKSDYLVQDNIYSTAQQTPAESLNDPMPEVESSTLPKTSIVPESPETTAIPSTTENSPIPYIAKSVTKNPDKLSSHPPVDSSLLGTGSRDLEKNTARDLPSSANLDCNAESVVLPELLDHVEHNSQLSSDLNSKMTTSTPDSNDFQQTCCGAESEQVPLSDSDKNDPDSESTYVLVPEVFSSDVQKTESGNTSIHVFDNRENRAPTLRMACSTVMACIPTTTKHNPDPHSDVAYSSTLDMFDSEGYIKEDMDKIDAHTGHGSGVRSVGLDDLGLKRKRDRESSMFTEAKTKKMQQIDPSQPMRVDNILSDEEENLKVHTCQHCSATFCSPYHLRRHVYTHTGERPFWCSLCNLGFIQKYRFRNHRMTHHRDTQSKLDEHIRKKRNTRSDNGDKPVLNELHEQSFSGSPAASSEPSSSIEEKTTSTSRDAKDVKLTADNQFVSC